MVATAAVTTRPWKALIKVGYGCNENCTFCHTLDVRHVDGEAAEVHAKIDRAKALGHGMVVLSGGEPTIRPELLAWASHVASLGMDFGLVTNGLMLAYPELVEKLVARRLRYVYQSLHGATAEVHERLTRTGSSFDAARAALGVLSGRGLDYTINCVITKQNVDALVPLVDLVKPYPDVVLKFSMLQPKGGGAKAFAAITAPVSEVAARVREAIAHGGAEARSRFAHDGIPLCLLRGYEDLYDDLRTHRFATMVEIGEPDFFPVDDRAKVQPEDVCGGCALRGPCPGLYAGYAEEFGHGELTPVRGGARSNSFNYVFEEIVADGVADGVCPLRDGPAGVTPWDRGRHLFVKHGARVGRFRTTTRDFADVEIERIKHERGQIYLDVSKKAAPDDFRADLVKLEPSALCGPCAERPRCAGMVEPRLDDDPFGRDDARVREIIGGLAGDVLDVGCGDGPYADVIAARRAAMRYVGLDPRGGAGVDRVGVAEDLEDVAAFDTVLVLRSWNHLRDPDRAVARMARALRAGGQLVVVDNVAFGLARTASQTARAERSPAAWEHYRNDDAGDAVRVLAAHGFTLVERRDVSPSTSNQWLLRAVRERS